MTAIDTTLAELLNWYEDAGVDAPMVDEPVDQFELSKVKSANPAQKPAAAAEASTPNKLDSAPNTPARITAPPAQGVPTVPDENAIQNAKDLAASAGSLEELRQILGDFAGCNLKFAARNTVFSDGTAQSPLMIIGDGPDIHEDKQGVPFVGDSGQLLDKMLQAIGLDRRSVYLTTVLPWRPPGNRAPSPQETAICRPFIERHIQLAKPKVLMAVGGLAAKVLLNTPKGILTLRGKWTEVSIDDQAYPTLPTLHPSYLMRQPEQKRMSWQDLLTVKKKLDEFSD